MIDYNLGAASIFFKELSSVECCTDLEVALEGVFERFLVLRRG